MLFNITKRTSRAVRHLKTTFPTPSYTDCNQTLLTHYVLEEQTFVVMRPYLMIGRSERDLRFSGGTDEIVTRLVLPKLAKTYSEGVAVAAAGATRGRGRGRGDRTEARSELSLERMVATRAFRSTACGRTHIPTLPPSTITATTYVERCNSRWPSTHMCMIMALSYTCNIMI
jgi:hypothetical protein